MLVDIHLHYPMHVRPPESVARSLRLYSRQSRGNLADHMDAAFIGSVGRLINHETPRSGPRVTVPGMREGGIGVALSVLCTPLVEMGNHLTLRYRRKPPYGGPPEDRYFDLLLRQLEAVEATVEATHVEELSIARRPADVDKAIGTGRTALVHCVEGGFSLGASPAKIRRSVQDLAGRGVAYITLAHLVWRHVATNVPSIPLMSDRRYNQIFPQPEIGLSELGRAAIGAMVEAGVLVDVTHMSEQALDDTFRLMDEIDPGRYTPVLASHCGFRFGRHGYNLSERSIARIAERDGVIGLILSPYYLADGMPGGRPRSLEQSIDLLCSHIDQIASITGSHRHIALGSDLDGFIKPTLAGLEDCHRLAQLASGLEARYGAATVEPILSSNALRVLRNGWQGSTVTSGEL